MNGPKPIINMIGGMIYPPNVVIHCPVTDLDCVIA